MLDKLAQLRKYTKGYEDLAMEGASKAKSFYNAEIKGKTGRELYDRGRRRFTEEALATTAAEDQIIGNAAMYNAGAGAVVGGLGSIGQDEGFMSSAMTGAAIGAGVGGGIQRRNILMRNRGTAAKNMANAQDNMSKFQSELDSVRRSRTANTSPFPFMDGAKKRSYNDRIANLEDNIKAEGKILNSNKEILSGNAVSNYKYGALAGAGVMAHNILDGNDPLRF